MEDIEDPVDKARTTRPRAGMVFKDRRELPGLAMLLLAVLALVGSLSAAAQHQTGWSLGFGILVLVLAVGGLGWMLVGRKRSVRDSRAGQHRDQT